MKRSNMPIQIQNHHLNSMACPGFENVWYMCYYFRSGTSDYISRQLMDFKRGDIPPREAFGNLAAKEFTGLEKRFDYIARVLGSKELVAKRGHKVASVALKIYETGVGNYHPNLVKKNRETREMKGLNKDQRKAELEGVYEINQPVDLNNKSVLIVDDIFTFGTSFEAIGDVLREANPRVRLFGFALARNWHRGDEGIMVNESDFINRYKTALAEVS